MSQRTGANIVTQNTGTAQRYDSFAAALGSSFAWVTTKENGAEVHGKYSFPGSDEALQGQDFPFPTVLVQDNVFGRARLHYGWWPSSGLYWSKGLLTLDMITDYDAAGRRIRRDAGSAVRGHGSRHGAPHPVLYQGRHRHCRASAGRHGPLQGPHRGTGPSAPPRSSPHWGITPPVWQWTSPPSSPSPWINSP